MNEIKIKDKNSISFENVKKITSITPKLASLVLDYSSVAVIGEGLEISYISESQTEINLKGIIKEIIFDNGKTKRKEGFFKKLFE